ncbi:MAG: DMT family transporter [Aquificae bacterium]|nr:DMT family transporter [Aquificota bacterium]
MNHAFGVILALLSAIFWATNDIFNKKSLIRGYDENFVLWIRFPIGVVLLVPLGVLFWDFNLTVLWTTFLWLPSEIIASIYFIKGIKVSPLSVSMPFFAFMPLFSSIFGYVILDEKIEPTGWLGIGLILLGSFIVSGGSPLSFFKVNRGSLYILISAGLFGFNVVIGKLAIVESNPYFFAWYYCLVMSLGLLPFVGFKELLSCRNYKNLLNIPMGVLFSLGMLAYTIALTQTYASYVASVERLAIILDIIYGQVIFKEKFRRSSWGVVPMVFGAILLGS